MSIITLNIGDNVTAELSGVPEWKIPPQTLTATATADNVDALSAEINDAAEHGGARVTVNGETVREGR